MSAQQGLSDEVALRIGLAARALPEADSRVVMTILFKAFGKPITVRKLSRLRFNQFRRIAEPLFKNERVKPSEKQLREAFAFLQGRGIHCEPEPLPPVVPYQQGDMPGSIRVACTCDNGHLINGQFATCDHFLIYQVAAEEYRLVDIRHQPKPGGDEDKNSLRALLISDCHVLCTTVIGGPAASKVVRAGVHPLRVQQPVPAPVFLRELQQVLQHNTPPWLAKIMEQESSAVTGSEIRRQMYGEC